jgi:gluconate 5-dehydrogenase
MNTLDMFKLDGQVAIVTGGATGLGLQMATALAEAGAHIVMASRNAQRCEEVAESLRAAGHLATAMPLDLNDANAPKNLVRAVMERYGRVDILVNNAAATDVNKPFEEFDVARWEGVMRVNLTGVMLCAQAVFEPMKQQGHGKLINIASVYGMVGIDASLYGATPEHPMRNMPYTASKGAIVNLTRELAVSWAPYGINVNAICPGMFPVESNLKKYPDGTFDRVRQRIPLGRMGTATDLKGAVVFLASAASDYVTGHNLVVDGGWVAW